MQPRLMNGRAGGEAAINGSGAPPPPSPRSLQSDAGSERTANWTPLMSKTAGDVVVNIRESEMRS